MASPNTAHALRLPGFEARRFRFQLPLPSGAGSDLSNWLGGGRLGWPGRLWEGLSGCFQPLFFGCKRQDRLGYKGLVPRANRYFVPGKIYHLTHRCHDRQFLFRFARDRDAYRKSLWETVLQARIRV